MKYSHDKPIRLMEHYALDGPLTLAFDYALQQALRNDPSQASVLRLHTFGTPTLSVGYDRTTVISHIDFEACRRDGIAVVQRPVSGTAVLKTGEELCFTFITSPRHWDNFSFKTLYRMVNEIIVDALEAMGVHTTLAGRNYSGGTYNCFANTDQDEVLGGNFRKLVGSGLFANSGVYMQEGVIPLTPRYRDVSNYLVRVKALAKRAPTSIFEEIHEEVEPALVASKMVQAFGDNLPLEPSEFTELEVKAAQQIRGRYFQDRAVA